MGKTHTSIIGEGVDWFGLGEMIILLKLLQFTAVSFKTFVPKTVLKVLYTRAFITALFVRMENWKQ